MTKIIILYIHHIFYFEIFIVYSYNKFKYSKNLCKNIYSNNFTVTANLTTAKFLQLNSYRYSRTNHHHCTWLSNLKSNQKKFLNKIYLLYILCPIKLLSVLTNKIYADTFFLNGKAYWFGNIIILCKKTPKPWSISRNMQLLSSYLRCR